MKLDIVHILKESLVFYKKYFKKVSVFALINFVISLLIILTDAPPWLKQYVPNQQISAIILAIIAVPVFILWPKLNMALPIYINSAMSKDEITIIEAFKKTKGKYCRYILNYLFVALCCILLIPRPLFVSILFHGFQGTIFFVYTTYILLAFITAFYYTLTPMIAIEGEYLIYVKKASRLVDRNYLRILLIVLVTTTIFLFPYTIIYSYFKGQPTILFYSNLASACVYFFTFSYASVVAVTVYRKLKEGERLESDMND